MKKARQYRKNKQGPALFDHETTMENLSKLGNPLEVVDSLVDFEMFRPVLESALFTEEHKGKAGRPPIDPVLMFRMMSVRRLYGLSDEQTEYQAKDWTSFRNFLGVIDVSDVPDARTLWAYRERLVKKGVFDTLFKTFHAHLRTLGLIVREVKMIDAGFVACPRQRNTREGNKAIKEGRGDGLWQERPHKKSHKDTRNHPLTDARKASNRLKSKIRSRVEHVFGFIERSMGGLIFRGVGILRAKANVALTNLVYNIARLCQIKRNHPQWIVM